MEKKEKLVYCPPRLEAIDMKLLCNGDDIVPGGSKVLPPDEDPDF